MFSRFLVFGVLLAAPLLAQAKWELPECASEIADYYSVPEGLLGAIRQIEGGEVGQRVGPNRNGSYDLGPMQINTHWFDGTFNVDLRDYDIHEVDVLKNECTNLAVGAWVLSHNYKSLKDWYEATAAYNAGIRNRSIGYGYAQKVFSKWNQVPYRTPLNKTKPLVVAGIKSN